MIIMVGLTSALIYQLIHLFVQEMVQHGVILLDIVELLVMK